MTEITLEITNFCVHECEYCSTDADLDGDFLPISDIANFLMRYKEDITRINISGGEPLAHPNFYNILQLCYVFTPNVVVYTNALQHIIYNPDVIKEIEVEANVVVYQGKEVYIPKNVKKVHLLKLVNTGRAQNLPKSNITVSHNFDREEGHNCSKCNNVLLQADGNIVESPCKKKYRNI